MNVQQILHKCFSYRALHLWIQLTVEPRYLYLPSVEIDKQVSFNIFIFIHYYINFLFTKKLVAHKNTQKKTNLNKLNQHATCLQIS